ncbi:hypothetical protein [Qipengyuania sphaerica]|uniref:hypothetical protein n=1 Tax=Qipengyuania sphaerica TaxID=2867243 RepID=UPI001C87833D|nr:hypothetical protein [Qipengyuania sphaerica]MBX7541078.1 hypothetical protein [Qipengyuania sphaerica]
MDFGLYFKRFIFRMGVIFTLACSIFVVGKIYNFINPPSANAAPRTAAEAMASAPRLDASLFDSRMQVALTQWRASGKYEGSDTDGARMQFPSPDGPVVLSRSDVAGLNTLYRRMTPGTGNVASREEQFEDFQRENLDANGWGNDTGY